MTDLQQTRLTEFGNNNVEKVEKTLDNMDDYKNPTII